MKILLASFAASLLLLLAACGGSGTSASTGQNGPLAGNWEFTLTPSFPKNAVPMQVSGFLLQSKDAVSGSVQLPGYGSKLLCAGQGPVTGTVSSSTVTISIDESGSTLSLTGVLASGGKSMTGTYEDLGGACFKNAATGTFSAALIPPLSGTFSGFLNSHVYMPLLNNSDPNAGVVIPVTGTFTQGANIGSSSASVTGTIAAQGYPCLSVASFSGTISGNSVYLGVYGANQSEIGLLGQLGTPAHFSVNSSGVAELQGNTAANSNEGLTLGLSAGTQTGPCPPLPNSDGTTQKDDKADVCFAFSSAAQCTLGN